MKKSNLILLGGLIPIVVFFLSFQWKMHRYMKNDVSNERKEPVISETRAITNFEKLAIGVGFQVFFEQDTIPRLRIEAPKSSLPSIQTDLQGTTLRLQLAEGKSLRDTINVYLGNSQLQYLEVGTTSSFETINPISGTYLELKFDDRSNGKLHLSYKKVKCMAGEGAKVHLTGNSDHIDFSNEPN